MNADDSPVTEQTRRPTEGPRFVVRNLGEAREARESSPQNQNQPSSYLDVSWPDPPYGISDPGYKYFKEEVEVFIQNLMNTARNIARDANLESISSVHVKEALKLFSNKPQTRRSKLFEISGGLLAGAAISFILAGDLMSKGLPYQIVICGAGFAGALMIGLSLRSA